MILPIYVYGSPVLREATKEIEAGYPDLDQLIANMFETMKQANGVGLAAPQVGLSLRLFIVDGTELTEDYEGMENFKRVIINPVVIAQSEKMVNYSEGCLSVPGINCDVERPETLTLSYKNERFEPVEETFTGFGCRMVQHELAHLEGQLFTDLATPIRKKMIQSKLLNISKGHAKASYKVRVGK